MLGDGVIAVVWWTATGAESGYPWLVRQDGTTRRAKAITVYARSWTEYEAQGHVHLEGTPRGVLCSAGVVRDIDGGTVEIAP